MSEFTPSLERTRERFRPAPGGFDRLLARHERKRRRQRVTTIVVALALTVLAVVLAERALTPVGTDRQLPGVHQTAPAPSSREHDPVGDTVPPSPGYLDLTGAGVLEHNGTFVFTLELARRVPSEFRVPAPWGADMWPICVDTDPLSDPNGYPFATATPAPCEFIVIAHSSGGRVVAELIDRRPLVGGGKAIAHPIPVTLDGSRITMTVARSRLGDPVGRVRDTADSAVRQ
jgi:hypothetical protein